MDLLGLSMRIIGNFYSALIFFLSIICLPQRALAETESTIQSGDVAWMLSATALVLLMTPGLSDSPDRVTLPLDKLAAAVDN